ncbi:iron-containing alcohol dehydrogenase [Pedobacter arcticus]|uniref:iron-containing alcohol dehydrogenase n=1 Tax=Pedobacter arcticus TaxID=752140 RepID=UPI0002FDAE22|nr:iron-containing alcohol dehydrogenase [Pedobacter arcticus]
MDNTNYHYETKILKGSNVLENLCDECLFFGNKVLVVFSENAIKQSGLYARVVSLLNINGIEHITYECAGNNYTSEDINSAIELGKKENVQMILSIGDEELTYFTKVVAHDFHGADLGIAKQKKHLPIINISSLLKSNKKSDFDFLVFTACYAAIKPVAQFLDYDI